MCEPGQQIILGYYPVMRRYRKARAKAGLPENGICVDRCMVSRIIDLWKAGIRTYGCCCGHGDISGFINIDEADFEKAMELGWEQYHFEDQPDRKDTIFAKKSYPCDL